jgi:hypothetical protein
VVSDQLHAHGGLSRGWLPDTSLPASECRRFLADSRVPQQQRGHGQNRQDNVRFTHIGPI